MVAEPLLALLRVDGEGGDVDRGHRADGAVHHKHSLKMGAKSQANGGLLLNLDGGTDVHVVDLPRCERRRCPSAGIELTAAGSGVLEARVNVPLEAVLARAPIGFSLIS